jgi:hypothetical protein
LVIRILNIDCPTSEFQPFQLTFSENVSIVNITTTGFCFIGWNSFSSSNVFNVSDSWVSAGMRTNTNSGSFLVGRYFNISNFGGNALGTKMIIPSIVSARNLRSRVSIGLFGFSSLNDATSIEFYSMDIRRGSSGYIDLPRGRMSLVDSTIQDFTVSVGEITEAVLTLNNTSSNNLVLLKTPTTVGHTSKLIANGRVSISILQQHRGASQLYVNGNLTTSSYYFYQESPSKAFTNASEVFVTRGSILSTYTTGGDALNALGWNTRFWINGTLQLGSGSANRVSTVINANTSEPSAAIVFACQDDSAEIISDPIAFRNQVYLYGCNYRTVASPLSQDFFVFSVEAGAQVVLDGESPYLATRFSSNCSITGTIVSYPSTTRKVLAVNSVNTTFNADLVVGSALAVGETLQLVSFSSPSTVSVRSVSPNTYNPVANSTFAGIYRPVPPPEAPPVEPPVAPPVEPPVAPPVEPPTDAPVNPPSGGGIAPSGAGNTPSGSAMNPSSTGSSPTAASTNPSGAPTNSALSPQVSSARTFVANCALFFFSTIASVLAIL